MKKLIVLLSISCLFLTGCQVINMDDDIEYIVNTIMNNDTELYNVHFDGYKYYVPKGMKFINKEEYNASFRDRFNNKYYLYVDIISYYHNVDKKYEENNNFYSKELKYDDKYGYLDIEEIDGKYYIQFMYNYAKIEVYTDKNHLDDVICNASYLVKSIDYNDKILNSLIGDNQLDYKEENFNIFDTEVKKDNFLNYEKEYDNGSSKKEKDEDYIDIES